MDDLKSNLKLFNVIVDALLEDEQKNPVSRRIEVENLYRELDLSLEDDPIDEDRYLQALQEIVLSTPKTASKLFFNQLFGGRQPKAILGDLLAVMLNNSMYTYKVAGPQVGVEKEILKKVCAMIGYGENSGGTFPTGGSMSNFMGLLMARDKYDADVRQNGISKSMIAYTSEESHYSISKNATFVGIGRRNVRFIPANDRGEMIPQALEKQIIEDKSKGLLPFFVNATAGTTVLGAFDPADAIGDICKRYNVWFHIDGAYCGGVIFSNQYKHLLKGVEKSDSFSFNAHKMFGTPLTCSIVVVQNKKHLYNSFSNDAEYLYQTDHDDYNLGKTSFQCGRRNDGLKFWTLWKSVGTKGLEKMIHHQFHLAEVARDYIANHPDYELYSFENSISVCFNYKGIDAKKLCTALYEHHALVVGFGKFRHQQFVRLVTINTNNNREEILNFFRVLEDFVAVHGDGLDLQEKALPKEEEFK